MTRDLTERFDWTLADEHEAIDPHMPIPVGLAVDVYAAGESEIAPEITPETMFWDGTVEAVVAEAFNRLHWREQYVLEARLNLSELEPMTLKELGDELDITGERVRQIQERALRKVAKAYTEFAAKEAEEAEAPDVAEAPIQTSDETQNGLRWSPQQIRLQRQWFAWREAHPDDISRARSVFPPRTLTADQATAAEEWRTELIQKQDNGEIAFVRGDLLKRPLPPQIAEYLETGRFEDKSGIIALRTAYRAAKAESDPELQKEIALEKAHEEAKATTLAANRAHTKVKALESKLEAARDTFEKLAGEGAEAIKRERLIEES